MTATMTGIEVVGDLDGWLPRCRILYNNAFADLSELAVQQHLMTDDEFTEMARDPSLSKYLALGGDLTMLGMSVLTNRLAAWSLVAPAFFRRRWPTEYAENRIFYVGFVCTRRDAPNHVFRDLIERMYQDVIAVNGIAVMDFCTYMTMRRIPGITHRILSGINPATTSARIDTQEFWAYRFDGGTL